MWLPRVFSLYLGTIGDITEFHIVGGLGKIGQIVKTMPKIFFGSFVQNRGPVFWRFKAILGNEGKTYVELINKE